LIDIKVLKLKPDSKALKKLRRGNLNS